MKNNSFIIFCGTVAVIGLMPIGALAHGDALAGDGELSAQLSGRLEVLPNHYHVAGNSIPTSIRLTWSDGKPLTFGELEVGHTKKIHLLIVDESLSDFQHAHPDETDTPGEYRFVFNPKFGGRYHIWANFIPKATDKQDYARTVMTVGGDPAPAGRPINSIAERDGYRYELAMEDNEPLRVGQATLLNLTVRQADGRDFAGLEPVMGAFAHVVGFTPKLDSVIQAYPTGEETKTDATRGGSKLSFRVTPERAGYLKLYVQTQIRGLKEFVAFGLNVEPSAPASNPAKLSPAIDTFYAGKSEF